MRDLAFVATLLALLPLAVARPFAGVLLWSWISFLNPHQMLWSLAAAAPWAAIVFGATVLGCVFAGEPKRLALNAVTVLLVALAFCFTATSLAALGPPDAVWGKWGFVIKVQLGLLLTASLLTDRWRVHALVWLMVVSIGYFGVKGGLSTIVTAGGSRIIGPPNSMIGDNNHLGAALLAVLPLMNYLRLHSVHAVVRRGLAAAMVLTLFAVVGTYSRGALIGLAAVSVVLWLRGRNKIVMALAMSVCLAGAVSFMPDRWADRMNTIQTYEEDASAASRIVLWGMALKLALDRPLVGSGFTGPYKQDVVDRVDPGVTARAVHSIWFEVLGEHGFPTFAVWTALTLAGLFYSVRLTRMTRGRPGLAWAGDLARMAQVSIVAYLVSGSFLSLSYWDFYWTLLVVLGATHALAVRAIQEEGKAPETLSVSVRARRPWPGPVVSSPALGQRARDWAQ